MSEIEKEEREYLEVIKEKLQFAISRADDLVKEHSTEFRQNQEYNYENQSGMDEADRVAAGQSIKTMTFTGESVIARKKKLLKLGSSPYFGRIDFSQGDGSDTAIVYIGIYSFADDRSNLIFDWRAPVSSMFYDFELGPAWYKTPSGKIEGELKLKRQYKIRDGRMEFMIENSINIQDEVLQKELSKSSDDKMKNIVATIQRDQNAVIRNETASVMIIQGVAGSGKTSIALHRIAFLLYRFRETIRSRDVLIISPNKVFASYISNVLPELGEEHIPEIGMEELASDLLGPNVKFHSFFDQVAALLESREESYIERIRFKASFSFMSKLNQYIIHLENNFFEAAEIRVAGIVVPFPFIQEKLKAYHRIPLLKRFPEVIKDVLSHVRTAVNRRITGAEKAKIWEAVPRMIKMGDNVFDLYRDFYKWIGKEDMFKMGADGNLEYADVFPLIYCKIRLEGIKAYDHVKHLLIDEMQDYTPVQYGVLSRLFTCKKTILGDVSQKVNPYSSSSAEGIEQVFPQGDTIKLHRSYRSTFEITSFAQTISNNPDVIPMERHGDAPQVKGFEGNSEEVAFVRASVEEFKKSNHQTLGIICKTQPQADKIYTDLKGPRIHLLRPDSTTFAEGVIITTAHLAKGLEFDEVIIPFASAKNYSNDMDRSMLYIACTRAMHRLTLTYSKDVTAFVQK